MKIYPAIDIMDGKAVRLLKGRKDTKKVYGDPISKVKDFSNHTDKIHIVDLDGAFEGDLQNLDVVRDLIEETGVKVQLGGGLRTYEDISRAYSIGVENAILGTSAFDLDLLERVTEEFEGITVSLDSMDGKIAVEGWREEEDLTVQEGFKSLKDKVERFIYTSTERDGVLAGVEEVERFWNTEEFIYAGGVTSMEDIDSLQESGFTGAIIGKALYEGELDLGEIIEKEDDEVC